MNLIRFSAESSINSLAVEQNGRNLVAGDVGGNVYSLLLWEQV